MKAEGNSVAVHSMGDAPSCVSAHCWQLILYKEQGLFQANVKYCQYFCFLEGLHPLSVWGQTDCGDSRSEGAGVGFEEHGIRSAAEGIQPEIPDPLHQSIPQQTGMAAMAAVTFLLDILQENGSLFSSLVFSGGVFYNQTL